MGIIGRDGQELCPQGEGGGFVPANAVAEEPPLWSGAPKQGHGEQELKPHTQPPLGEDP